MAVLESINLGIRFFVEVAALFALGWWGWQRGRTQMQQYVLAAIAPLVGAALWGMFVASNAPVDPGTIVRVGLQVLIFGAAVFALIATGLQRLGLAFGIIALVNGILLYVLDS